MLRATSAGEIEATLQAIAVLGLRANNSVIDVSLFHSRKRDNPYPDSVPAEVLVHEYKRYGKPYALPLRRREKPDHVTFWSLRDSVSWLNHKPCRGYLATP